MTNRAPARLRPGASRRLVARAFGVHAGLCVAAALVATTAAGAGGQVGAAGIALPGAGFWLWAWAGGGGLAVGLGVAASLAFALSLVVWIGAGAVLAPVTVWALLGALGALGGSLGLEATNAPSVAAPALGLAALSGAVALALAVRPVRRVTTPVPARARAMAEPAPARAMDEADRARVQMLLDRALQPLDRFDGFDRRDEFQTAATRYQINFCAYGLAVARRGGDATTQAQIDAAQRRLHEKLSLPQVWSYWRRESLMAGRGAVADPVARENIMFSGFLALQRALARAAAPQGVTPGPITLDDGRGFRRTLDENELIEGLARQYGAAPLGLLACEPGWVYPLCNIMTACALAAHEARGAGAVWSPLADRFADALEHDFTGRDGRLMLARSGLVGLAIPSMGSAINEAFCCLFLNPVFPDIAAQRWERLRGDLAPARVRRSLWPVDVGNYRLHRAAGYAACAAAAAELGDEETKLRMLGLLEREHPATFDRGAAHRPGVSLWTHGVEVMARSLGRDDMRRMLTAPAPACALLAAE